MKKLVIIAFATLGVMGQAQAAGDAAAGQAKAAVCSACHGPQGNSPANPLWPKQAGQHEGYVVKQLKDFKSGARKDDTMIGMVAALSEQDMADIAAFWATQTISIGSADPEKAELGRKIYQGGIVEKGVAACMACHGPAGDGNPAANFPSLNGQHAAYTAKALNDFRSGIRTNDPQGMMQGVAASLSDAEIEAVAQYIMGLH